MSVRVMRITTLLKYEPKNESEGGECSIVKSEIHTKTMKRASRKPRKVSSGRRGRPRKEYRLIPIKSRLRRRYRRHHGSR